MIYYDISDIFEYARHNSSISGIQRVSISKINYIVNKYGPDSIRLIGYHPDKKVIVTYEADYFRGVYDYEQAAFCAHFGLRIVNRCGSQGVTSLGDYVGLKYGQTARGRFHMLRLSVLNILSQGQTFRKRRIAGRSSKSATDHSMPAKPIAGDSIYVPGATWRIDALLDFLKDASQRGVKIVQFVHDLIPLVTPEHVVDGVPEQFRDWLSKMVAITHTFVVNSHSTERDLTSFLASSGVSRPIEVVPLAHEFPLAHFDGAGEDAASRAPSDWKIDPDDSAAIRAEVLNAALWPFVLVVGTVESRKNVWGICQVWKSIVEELGLGTPRLIFAGRLGSLASDFEGFISGTGALGGHIRIVERPSDQELLFLYRKCRFSVCASFYEGWGLPVGESLWLGRPVAASACGAIPEVGGDMIDYFDPTNLEDMRNVIRRLLVDDDYLEERRALLQQSKMRTWADVAEDTWQVLQGRSDKIS
jgi:glycosyltransferase involved in cell wall biosynthesis